MQIQTAAEATHVVRAFRTVVLGMFVVFTCTVTLCVVHPGTTTAATNATLNFQARLETSSGAIVPDGTYNVEFKVYSASSSSGSSQGSCTGDSACLWTETRTGANQVRVANGYLSVNLGSVTAFPGTINWNQQLWLTMNIGGTGGTPSWDGEMSPRLVLTAVPYAFQAGALGQTDGGGHLGTLSFTTTTNSPSITLPDASGTVCLQSSSACGFATGSGTAFLQGGNSFGAQGELGTNDAYSLAIRTNNADRLVVDTSGNLKFQQASIINMASSANGFQLSVTGGAATGGTNTGGNLLLQGGAGASTGASGSVIVQSNGNNSTTAFQVQTASGTSVLNADTTSSTVTVRAGNDARTLGPELYSGINFSSGWTTTGWDVVTNPTQAEHTTGNTNSLINTSVSILAGATYQVGFYLGCNVYTGLSTDTLTISIGGTAIGTVDGTDCNDARHTMLGTAVNTNGLTFTPTSGSTAFVYGISIKQVSGAYNPALAVANASGATNLEVRASSSTTNTFIGLNTGANTTSGTNNTAVGSLALQSNVAGTDNTVLGASALQANVTGASNTAIGSSALKLLTDGDDNTAIGKDALLNTTVGSENTALGYQAGTAITVGGSNVAIGSGALAGNSTGSYNVAIGSSAGGSGSGDGNVAIGYFAGVAPKDGSNNNLFLGQYAGWGEGSFFTSASLQNAAAIGASAQVQASNSVVLGSVATPTNVGIGITMPQNIFSVSPLDYSTGTVCSTAISGGGSCSGTSTTFLLGSGTTWTSAMVGETAIFDDGNVNTAPVSATITGFTDSTHLTLSSAVNLASGTHFRFHYIGLQVTSAGNVSIGTSSSVDLLNVGGSTGEVAKFATEAGLSDTPYISIGGGRVKLGYDPSGTGNVVVQGANGKGIAFNVNNNTFASGTVAVLDTSGNLKFQQASIISAASSTNGYQLTIVSGAATSGTNAGGNLLLQGGAGASTGASGSVIVKSNVNNSTTAFQVQNASGTSVLQVDTSGLIVTVAGTTSAFGSLTLANAHFASTQTTAPTIGTPASCGTTPTASVGSGSTDAAGSFTIHSGSGTQGKCSVVVTFNKAYGAAPKSVLIVPASANSATTNIYVSGTATTTFTAAMNVTAPAASTDYLFYYWVVQ